MPTLDWLSRQDAFTTAARVPYRLLDQVSLHGDAASNVASQGNLLIQGDNLEALKALLPFYRGQVKCIFIDPPYNTKSAFEHYDDNLEHSQWLSMMLPRLQLLRELLREDGSIWVTIDDNEGHYLKVLMDEVFGRGNFVTTFIWQKVDSPNDNKVSITPDHEFVLAYAKSLSRAEFHRKYDPTLIEAYGQVNSAGRRYRDRLLKKNGKNSLRSDRPTMFYPLTTPDGSVIFPIHDDGREANWALGMKGVEEAIKEERLIWKQRDRNGKPVWIPYTREFAPDNPERPHPTILLDVKTSRQAKAHQRDLHPDAQQFDTVKPEQLIERIFNIASNENDLILDSFLGSGTTAAVAHKMRRRWIGIEMGEHAATHCLPRLEKVIDGEQGGISKAQGWGVAALSANSKLPAEGGKWHGGGGFRFMRLGEPVFDETGRISAAVRFNTLAAFIWQQETRSAWVASQARAGTPHLGIYYEIDSALRSIDMGEVPKTLKKSPENEDLFDHPSSSQQEPTEPASPTVSKPRFALYLLYNGILKDKRPESGNVLTAAVLDALLALHEHVCAQAGLKAQDTPLTVYGEACRQGPERLARAGVTFKHIPYDVRAR